VVCVQIKFAVHISEPGVRPVNQRCKHMARQSPPSQERRVARLAMSRDFVVEMQRQHTGRALQPKGAPCSLD
jgi:hypothetical protein